MLIRLETGHYIAHDQITEVRGNFPTLELVLTLRDGRKFSRFLKEDEFEARFERHQISAKSRQHAPWTKEELFNGYVGNAASFISKGELTEINGRPFTMSHFGSRAFGIII